jgi:hypothetical protein
MPYISLSTTVSALEWGEFAWSHLVQVAESGFGSEGRGFESFRARHEGSRVLPSS